MTARSAATTAADWEARIDDALAGRIPLDAYFQPVVDLRRRTVVGYEALARFGVCDGESFGPDEWFAAAHAAGRAHELEARVLRGAFAARADLPRNCFLAVNVEPESLTQPAVRDAFAEQGGLGGIVVEITEHRPLDLDALEAPLAQLRGAGALIAVDDAGAGYAGLQQILELRPAIVKLDKELVSGIDHDEAKAALTEMLGQFANRIDAWLLAEGIEHEGEARRLLDLGVPLAQGFYFGRAAVPWAAIDPIAARDLQRAADAPAHGLHLLVDVVGAVDELTAMAAPAACAAEPWTPVIDANRRPVGLLTSDSALTGTLVDTLVANVHSTPAEVAQRLSTAAAEPAAPIVVVDNAGRYLGLVALRRILSHLGGSNRDDPSS
jgi:EAL domain-containing protein (putative c-di-GMP-specific phosphodiesterase class I)